MNTNKNFISLSPSKKYEILFFITRIALAVEEHYRIISTDYCHRYQITKKSVIN